MKAPTVAAVFSSAVLVVAVAGCGSTAPSAVRPTRFTPGPSATPSRVFRATRANAPCRRLEFAGHTYLPAPEQPGLGVGGTLTSAGGYADGRPPARARGIDCLGKALVLVEVYSSMEQSPMDAVTVSGASFGIDGVWEYVTTRWIH